MPPRLASTAPNKPESSSQDADGNEGRGKVCGNEPINRTLACMTCATAVAPINREQRSGQGPAKPRQDDHHDGDDADQSHRPTGALTRDGAPGRPGGYDRSVFTLGFGNAQSGWHLLQEDNAGNSQREAFGRRCISGEMVRI